MITTELLDYIRAELQKGTSDTTITNNLVTNGWFREDIQQAINQIQSPQIQPSPVLNDDPPADPPNDPPNSDNYYPNFTISRIEDPNRFYAFPILGFIYKEIILIPVDVVFFAVSIASTVLTFINAFIVLFTGKYWQTAFDINSGALKLSAKMTLFRSGLTNTYPGFSFDIKDNYTIDINNPQVSSRFFAIPLLGGVARLVLLIPFLIVVYVLQVGSMMAATIASFPVLFSGHYPESLYEFNRDFLRYELALSMYMFGLSDKYPSFAFSMNHKAVKVSLIVLASLYLIFSYLPSILSPKRSTTTRRLQNYYYSTPTPTVSYSIPQY